VIGSYHLPPNKEHDFSIKRGEKSSTNVLHKKDTCTILTSIFLY
jgi:hypothetical protein